jgi:hypothetical protein
MVKVTEVSLRRTKLNGTMVWNLGSTIYFLGCTTSLYVAMVYIFQIARMLTLRLDSTCLSKKESLLRLITSRAPLCGVYVVMI